MKKKNSCPKVKGGFPPCQISPEPDNEFSRAINEAAKKIFAVCEEFNKKYDPYKLFLRTEDKTYPNLSPDELPKRSYRISADFTSFL